MTKKLTQALLKMIAINFFLSVFIIVTFSDGSNEAKQISFICIVFVFIVHLIYLPIFFTSIYINLLQI